MVWEGSDRFSHLHICIILHYNITKVDQILEWGGRFARGGKLWRNCWCKLWRWHWRRNMHWRGMERNLKTMQASLWRSLSVMCVIKTAKEETTWKGTNVTCMQTKKGKSSFKQVCLWCLSERFQEKRQLEETQNTNAWGKEGPKLMKNRCIICCAKKLRRKGRPQQRDLPWLPLAAQLLRQDSKSSSFIRQVNHHQKRNSKYF